MSHQTIRRPARERGMAAMLVLFMSVVLAGLCFGLLQEGLAARTSLTHHTNNLRALELAEIGLVRAEMEIRSLDDSGTDGIGFVSGAQAGGTFEVVATPDPNIENRWTLTATGTYRLSKRRIEVGIRRRTNTQFFESLFSDEDLIVASVTTDAYDSRLGTYSSQITHTDAGGTFAGQGGSLGSNSDIYLDGTSVYVRGNAIPGPLRDTFEQGGPTLYGDKAPREFELEFAPPTYAEFQDAMLNNDNGSLSAAGHGNSVRYNAANHDLDVAGNATMTLSAGTYFFKSMHFRGGSQINVTGPVKIYVTDILDIGADADIIANSAADVQIFAHPYPLPDNSVRSETLVKVNGGSSITWSMYAPGAFLDIGGGNEFFGAAAANRIELLGSNAFHYDKALGDVGIQGAAIIERLYWKEQPLPRL